MTATASGPVPLPPGPSPAARPAPRPAASRPVQVVHRAADLTVVLDAVRHSGQSVGLVPTMGALHAGHRSLIERAGTECDHVVVTVFVNPLQFSDQGDLAAYPRSLDTDLATCREAGAATVFAPPIEEMYPSWPEPPATVVTVAGLTEGWEGASRPGHFDGVATVVAKLFALAGRCRAYFGEKDFQQLAVVRRLATDLALPVEVVGCPTVREPDGLALSSRNVRLSPPERVAATVLWRALATARWAAAAGERDPAALGSLTAAVVAAEPLAELDYAAAVDADDLRVPERVDDPARVRLLVAARFGPVRLIDNCPLAPKGPTCAAG